MKKKRNCLSTFLFEILKIEICLLTYASPVIWDWLVGESFGNFEKAILTFTVK